MDSLLGLPSPILAFLGLPLLLAQPHPSPSCESQAERDSPTRHHLKSTLQPHLALLQQLGWVLVWGRMWGGEGGGGCSPLLPRGEQ